MFLAGEASYRLENRILGNDFGRRSCLYPLLLGQIFKKISSSKKRRKLPVRKTDVFSSIFHRTELIFGGSRAKNCQESARTLRLCVAAQKNVQTKLFIDKTNENKISYRENGLGGTREA